MIDQISVYQHHFLVSIKFEQLMTEKTKLSHENFAKYMVNKTELWNI